MSRWSFWAAARLVLIAPEGAPWVARGLRASARLVITITPADAETREIGPVSRAVPAELFVLDVRAAGPGAYHYALDRPFVVTAGQRLVVRCCAPGATAAQMANARHLLTLTNER